MPGANALQNMQDVGTSDSEGLDTKIPKMEAGLSQSAENSVQARVR